MSPHFRLLPLSFPLVLVLCLPCRAESPAEAEQAIVELHKSRKLFDIDPQTGRRILDREVERRLSAVGRDVAGKRQANLVTRACPWIARRLELNVKGKVAYLDNCLKVSATEETAWLEFARLVKVGELGTEQKQLVLSRLPAMYRTFASYPDFILRLLDDLVGIQPHARERGQLPALTLADECSRCELLSL